MMLSAAIRSTASAPASSWLEAKRAQVLHDLNLNIGDRSLAGKVDSRVAPLVHWVNTASTCVTTSSCSGRILLFHRGNVSGEGPTRKRGSFGRGKLAELHDPVDDVDEAIDSIFQPALQRFLNERQEEAARGVTVASELLHLQFRPLIIHVVTDRLEKAISVLEAARESGQNSSGIISCSRGPPVPSQEQDDLKVMCCVTSSLTMDVPLGSMDQWLYTGSSKLPDTVPQEWLGLVAHCVAHANRLFTTNFERTQRLWDQMRRRCQRPPT